jgi:hypothetical protein
MKYIRAQIPDSLHMRLRLRAVTEATTMGRIVEAALVAAVAPYTPTMEVQPERKIARFAETRG